MDASPVLRVFDSAAELARHAAATLEAIAAHARGEGRRAGVALAGGSTPKLLYRRLAEEYRERVDWSALEVFFGDERSVPPDHPDSNYRMARETLLDRVPLPEEQVHRMPAEEDDGAAAARRYEETLRERLPLSRDGFPVFDLIWLGMGDDGHTASLFPGTAALEEESAWVAANEVPKMKTRRLTLTLPVINRARRVQFLVTGESKAAMVAAVFARLESEASPDDAATHPAARVRPFYGALEWLLDRAAAGRLDGPR